MPIFDKFTKEKRWISKENPAFLFYFIVLKQITFSLFVT